MSISLNKVLIVENELLVREHFKDVVADMGAKHILLAAKGEEAIAKSKDQNLDIILMDVVLPGEIDGIEAAKIIQKSNQVPIIFITAFQNYTRINRASELEACCFINKPVSEIDLKSSIMFTIKSALHNRQKIKSEKSETPTSKLNSATNIGLIEENMELECFFKSVPCAALAISSNGIIKRLNPALEDIFGYKKEELIGKNVKILIHGQHREKHDEYLKNFNLHMNGGIVGGVRRVNALRKNGEVFSAELKIGVGTCHGERFFVGTLMDMTKKDAEEERLHSLAKIIEECNDAITLVSLNGQFLSWNKGAQKMFGYSPSEILGEHVHKLVPPERQHESTELIAIVKGGKSISGFSTTRVSKNGASIPVNITVIPAAHQLDSELAVVCIYQDLRQSHSLALSLVATLCHEICNPLTVAMGMTEKIRDDQSAKNLKSIEKISLAHHRIHEFLLHIKNIETFEEIEYSKGTNMIKWKKT